MNSRKLHSQGNIHCLVVMLTILLSLSSTGASSATVVIDPTATGGFGTPNTGWSDMISSWVFSAGGEEIQINASGSISLTNASGFTTGPEGITRQIQIDGSVIGTNAYFPLEEAAVETGNLVLPRSIGTSIDQIGALMGAFVPEAISSSSTFLPRNEELVQLGSTGIPSSALFFIGEGLLNFESSEAGVLYLGINDTYAANNIGQYVAEITPVPVPPAFLLFGSAIVGLLGSGLKNRKLSKQ